VDKEKWTDNEGADKFKMEKREIVWTEMFTGDGACKKRRESGGSEGCKERGDRLNVRILKAGREKERIKLCRKARRFRKKKAIHERRGEGGASLEKRGRGKRKKTKGKFGTTTAGTWQAGC